MVKILFFDDYAYTSENQLFLLLLRKELKEFNAKVRTKVSIHEFEDEIQKDVFDVIILDIMAKAPKGFKRTDTHSQVIDIETGMELLLRCRSGVYGERHKTALIYIRSARGESETRRNCFKIGATGYFNVGGQDNNLIAHLKKQLRDKR